MKALTLLASLILMLALTNQAVAFELSDETVKANEEEWAATCVETPTAGGLAGLPCRGFTGGGDFADYSNTPSALLDRNDPNLIAVGKTHADLGSDTKGENGETKESKDAK